jgi:hypothetical protein
MLGTLLTDDAAALAHAIDIIRELKQAGEYNDPRIMMIVRNEKLKRCCHCHSLRAALNLQVRQLSLGSRAGPRLERPPPSQSEYSLSSDASALSPARLASDIVSKKTFENSIGLFLP